MPVAERILLIDDDADHLNLCKLILQRNGYEVTTLNYPDRIIEIIEEFKPELIFVDHYMNNITGIEVTKMIKSSPGGNNIPVIYFSSCDDIVKKAQEAGADDYLSKPFQFDKLIDATRKYLNKTPI